jgi:hypothetical protein
MMADLAILRFKNRVHAASRHSYRWCRQINWPKLLESANEYLQAPAQVTWRGASEDRDR